MTFPLFENEEVEAARARFKAEVERLKKRLSACEQEIQAIRAALEAAR